MATFTYKGASWTYNEVTAADGRVWMDRNLGATQVATSSTDTSGYGDLFQWGRLDDSHQTRTSGTTTTLSSTDVPGNANFIYGMGSPYDWRSPQNNNLWQNGLNVPAPAGWHIPTSTEWIALITAEGITSSTNAYSSSLKLTATGVRLATDASLVVVGTDGVYWSSSVGATTGAYTFNFNASSVSVNEDDRALGMTVRLIKDVPTGNFFLVLN